MGVGLPDHINHEGVGDMDMVNASRPTCDGHATGVVATHWDYKLLPCQAVTGLTTWTDASGQSHRACRHHLAGMRSRYPETAPACVREVVIEDHEGYVVVADVPE